MSRGVEITRMSGGTHVDPQSKGWSPQGEPDTWKITVRLTDTPNKLWRKAWEETTSKIPPDSVLGPAHWEVFWERQEIEIWVTEDQVEAAVEQMDSMLASANARCAELADQSDKLRKDQSERQAEERMEAARLQEKLDRL